MSFWERGWGWLTDKVSQIPESSHPRGEGTGKMDRLPSPSGRLGVRAIKSVNQGAGVVIGGRSPSCFSGDLLVKGGLIELG